MKPTAPVFFSGPGEFRAWLEAHHDTEEELRVGFFKVGTGKPSMTWNESVDEALCFGWIDGVRRRIDEERYEIRFTPRKPDSKWSRKNVESVGRLREEGRMRPAGLAAFEAGGEGGTPAGYSFERDEPAALRGALLERFRRQESSWTFFCDQPPGYRRTVTHWVVSAKRQSTRLRRLDRVIEVSGRGERVDLMKPFG